MAGQTNDAPLSENRQRMLSGQLYWAFTNELIAERERCQEAMFRFNDNRDVSRRKRVELWRDLVQDPRPMPPRLPDPADDERQFDESDGWAEPPLRVDYGWNVRLAPRAYLNANSVFLDTCPVTIGARTLIGAGCSFYSGSHPVDPTIRNGVQGPEWGKPIDIGEDCWLGGGVTVLPGIKIGHGAVVGAGSVVTKDVPALHVVAGAPARIIRKIDLESDSAKAYQREAREAMEAVQRDQQRAA